MEIKSVIYEAVHKITTEFVKSEFVKSEFVKSVMEIKSVIYVFFLNNGD